MKKAEGIEGLEWYRYTAFGGEEYGPYYLRDGCKTIAAISQCIGNRSRWWHTWVIPQGENREKLSCYAGSKERAMYFVESWVKYHYKREA